MGEGSGACSLLLLHHRSLLPPLHPQPLGLSGAGSSGRRCSRAAQQGGSSQGAPGDPTAQSRDKKLWHANKDLLIKPKGISFRVLSLSSLPSHFQPSPGKLSPPRCSKICWSFTGQLHPNPFLAVRALFQSGSRNTQVQTTRHVDFCKSGSKTK